MIDLELSLSMQANGQRRETPHGPMAKTLSDLDRYRDAIRRARPRLVIETGTWTGASAHWFGEAMMAAGVEDPLVVTIDRQQAPELKYFYDGPGYAICPLFGHSTEDPQIHELVRGIIAATSPPTMVVLDSDHQAPHVADELDLYGAFVTPGQYLVVEDTIARWVPGWTGCGSPMDAVEEWLPHHPEFYADAELEDRHADTQCPGGWLRRLA